MNRCVKCGRKIQNTETTNGIEFCKICWGYEEQILEKDKEIERLKNCVMTEEQVKQIMQEEMSKTITEQFGNGVYDKQLKSLAIKELKYILNLYEPYENRNGDTILVKNRISFIDYINNRIEELGVEDD